MRITVRCDDGTNRYIDMYVSMEGYQNPIGLHFATYITFQTSSVSSSPELKNTIIAMFPKDILSYEKTNFYAEKFTISISSPKHVKIALSIILTQPSPLFNLTKKEEVEFFNALIDYASTLNCNLNIEKIQLIPEKRVKNNNNRHSIENPFAVDTDASIDSVQELHRIKETKPEYDDKKTNINAIATYTPKLKDLISQYCKGRYIDDQAIKAVKAARDLKNIPTAKLDPEQEAITRIASRFYMYA
ncbi:MAG: hypothetical protein K2Q14_05640, partial [Gammaproteobacteria bacterium]|nr:hypothetical protein [Gammaproteobacteria bacterium]